MAGEKSLYHKIQLLLDHSKNSKAGTLADLASEIYARRLPTFNTLQYDERKDDVRWQPSSRVIRRTIALCRGLGLIDEEGQLTKQGRQGLREAEFDKILGSPIRAILPSAGLYLGRRNELIGHA